MAELTVEVMGHVQTLPTPISSETNAKIWLSLRKGILSDEEVTPEEVSIYLAATKRLLHDIQIVSITRELV